MSMSPFMASELFAPHCHLKFLAFKILLQRCKQMITTRYQIRAVWETFQNSFIVQLYTMSTYFP